MSEWPTTLSNDRLRLVCCSEALLAVDDRPGPDFGRLLGARIPDEWPPELYDEGARQYTRRFVEADREGARWAIWYVVLRGDGGGDDVAVGLAGFKGRPDPSGVVEVGYGILPSYRRVGIASLATSMLIDLAFADPAVTSVAAETYPELIGSIGVMLRNRMKYVGSGMEPGVIRYQVTREAWTAG